MTRQHLVLPYYRSATEERAQTEKGGEAPASLRHLNSHIVAPSHLGVGEMSRYVWTGGGDGDYGNANNWNYTTDKQNPARQQTLIPTAVRTQRRGRIIMLGPTTTTIATSGDDDPSEVANQFELYPAVAGTGPWLESNGSPVIVGQFAAGWTPVEAGRRRPGTKAASSAAVPSQPGQRISLWSGTPTAAATPRAPPPAFCRAQVRVEGDLKPPSARPSSALGRRRPRRSQLPATARPRWRR